MMKKTYSKPQTNVYEVTLESIIANSPTLPGYGGPGNRGDSANSKEFDFTWEEDF